MDLEWRSLSRTDAAAMAELNSAVHAADGCGDLRSVGEMDRSFDDDWRVATPVRFGAFAHGTLVAFSVLFPNVSADPAHRMVLWGMVHPAYRRQAVGTEVVGRGLKAAADLHARSYPEVRGLVMLETPDLPGTAELARECGFETGERSFEMTRTLPRDPSGFQAWIDRAGAGGDLAVIPFAERHIEQLRTLHNTSFVPDHPGTTPVPAEAWERRFSDQTFRPDMSFLMVESATREVVGCLLSNAAQEQSAPSGPRDLRLSEITTRRGHRRRGVATALIGAALSAAATGGFGTASLDVDTENPSGALRIYRRAGFTVAHSRTTYVRAIDA
jgi:ribosomal protein S18 acetylase RimI-like enzyme